ncbi:molybdopterin molybdotransferase MoeA [Microbacterium aurantiacum]|uniref:molybdopterin molybdotransferase MoeA n=1 Tax=Microbacterium aurantiacum TaxID=162393 RepID=UPI000B2CF64A|nr:gephyrin-like molybdotransferase Glp [Microbacterium chocolatum]
MTDDLIDLDAHRATVLAAAPLLASEVLPLAAGLERTLREPVHAAVDLPVFDNSAMDGFAVHREDVAGASDDRPARLRVVADIPAGSGEDPPLGPGEAARIMTGAPMPSGADTIVPFESTAGGLADSLDQVLVIAAPAPGVHVRRRGEDCVAGAEVLAVGTALGPLQLASAAAAGVPAVTVSRRPRVAVVSTGTELVAPGTPLRRGEIPESNGILLEMLAREAGAEIVVREVVDDTVGGPLGAIARAEDAAADLVIFSGGVSAGAYEVVKSTLGAWMTFSKVRMQPGKPQGFGVSPAGTLLFGLPGNPVSAAVSFEVFVRPALLAMQGRSDLARPVVTLPAARGWRTPPGRAQFRPVRIDRADPAQWRAVPATSGGSHLAGGLARAEAYAIVPAEVAAVEAGDLVDVMLIA